MHIGAALRFTAGVIIVCHATTTEGSVDAATISAVARTRKRAMVDDGVERSKG
jgi:hypothetical protein